MGVFFQLLCSHALLFFFDFFEHFLGFFVLLLLANGVGTAKYAGNYFGRKFIGGFFDLFVNQNEGTFASEAYASSLWGYLDYHTSSIQDLGKNSNKT